MCVFKSNSISLSMATAVDLLKQGLFDRGKTPKRTCTLPSIPKVYQKNILYRKRYRVAFHYIRYRSLTISLQRNAIADPPWQNPHSQDIDIKRGKEVKLSCETALFVVAPRTFGGGMATTWLLPLSHK